MKTTKQMTKAALVARVAELEAELKETSIERDNLGREVENGWWQRGGAEAQLADARRELVEERSGWVKVTDDLRREVDVERATRKNVQDQLEAERAAYRMLSAQVAELRAQAPTAPALDPVAAFAVQLGTKGLYRALARALHPDRGGDLEAMQALNAAWDRAKAN